MLFTNLLVSGYFTSLFSSVYGLSTGLSQALAKDIRAESPTVQSSIAGDAFRGSPFSDIGHVSAQNGHARIAEIYLSGCAPGEHVSLMGFGFRDLRSTTSSLKQVFHGSYTKDHQTFTLRKDEYIAQVYSTNWRKKDGRKHKTRLSWVKFIMNTDRVFECGSTSGTDALTTFEKGGQPVLYFSGTSGAAIDSLQASFIDLAKY